MFFSIIDFLFPIFAHAALIFGVACLIRAKTAKNEDHSGILPYATLPLIPLGLCLLYTYGAEAFIAWYGGNQYESDASVPKALVPWSAIHLVNILGASSTQLFWVPRLCKSPIAACVIGLLNLFQ